MVFFYISFFLIFFHFFVDKNRFCSFIPIKNEIKKLKKRQKKGARKRLEEAKKKAQKEEYCNL